MEEEAQNDILNLGGNIVLNGFNVVDRPSMTIVKKIVGNHLKKMSNSIENIEQLKLTLKKADNKNIFEVKAKLLANGKHFNSEVTEHNLFFALTSALEKIHSEISK